MLAIKQLTIDFHRDVFPSVKPKFIQTPATFLTLSQFIFAIVKKKGNKI